MQLTQMYIEQVLIGAMVIVTVIVLACGTLPAPPARLDQLAGGLLFIGCAYVVGIFYDRCADTLLERIERWNRIRFATEDVPYPLTDDPFWEYGSKLKQSSDTQKYLQSRTRILRATTTLLPAMTLALLVWRRPGWPFPLLVCACAIYLVTGLCDWLHTKVPTTNQWEKLNTLNRLPKREQRLIYFGPAVGGLAAMTALNLGVALSDDLWPWSVTIAFGGAVLTVITGWAWLRVAHTLMTLIRAEGGV